jgi:hypothetical protein
MKATKYVLALFLAAGSVACTSDFEEINTNPNAVTINDASARYFFTNTQVKLYAPSRYSYWRAHLLHADRYAGHFALGHNLSWWTDELNYIYNSGYTDATWDWQEGYFGTLDNFMRLTKEGGEFENERMYAVGQIMKGLYFQMYTDIFGEIPFSEVGNADIPQPKFDTQLAIYEGIIADLNEAMATIGDAARSGEGIEDLGNNDLFYGGDLQRWKALANTLKLRIALRAQGAAGANFQQAISEALNAPLLSTEADNALLEKDPNITQWASAAYGDVWHNFAEGSDWKLTETLIETLKDSNDPRLEKYAKPAAGGSVSISKPDDISEALWQKRTGYILSVLENAGVEYTSNETERALEIGMAADTYYVGLPARLRPEMKAYAVYQLFSNPTDLVIQKKNEGRPIFPEIVMTTAESYFLQAEAALLGNGADAESLFREGIRHAMRLWGVGESAIEDYIASSELANLSGDPFRKISIQRWIASYTDGFEAWSVVRKSGFPEEVANGVASEDPEIYGLGGINGVLPQRMQYGTTVQGRNGSKLQEAISRQGPDAQNVKLWWAK